MFYFTVPGRPIPAQRMTQKGKWNARSRRSLDYQEQVAWAAKIAIVQGLKGNLSISIDFYFRNRKHGDLDNHIKAILDGLQYGRVFENDRQVKQISAEIFYDDEERAEIRIKEKEVDSKKSESVNLCSRCRFAGSEGCKPGCDIFKAYEVGKAILEGEKCEKS